MWIARVACPLSVCQGFHRLCWDDVSPPDPSQVYAYACPFKGRLTLVNITGATWVKQGTPAAYQLQGLAAQLVEWKQRLPVTSDQPY